MDIKQELLELGFRIKSIGILYWVDTFKLIEKNPKLIKMMDIYTEISKKRGKSISGIERAMRYSIEPAVKKIQEKYDYTGKIDNIVFINLKRLEN